jgi:hypothetical protein
MSISGVEFAALELYPALKAAFETSVRSTLASAAGADVESVEVTTSAGVTVDYAITIPSSTSEVGPQAGVGVTATSVVSALSAPTSSSFLADLVEAMMAIPGIDNAVSGVLSVALSEPVITEATATVTATATTVSTTTFTAIADLTAYWDVGVCGPHGNDHNKALCPGNPAVCPETITTSSCSSGSAHLGRMYGDGTWASYVDETGCRYSFYAEYACDEVTTTAAMVTTTDATATSVTVTTTRTATTTTFTGVSELTAYWDVGNCGPHGDDHNMDWCSGKPATCRESITTDYCVAGTAHLGRVRGTGSWASYEDANGCKYSYFAEYVCDDYTTVTGSTSVTVSSVTSTVTSSITDTATTASVTATSSATTTTFTAVGNLTAYWDIGSCGPHGDDHNMAWCPGKPAVCAETISTDYCPAGTAHLGRVLGDGTWASYTDENGCRYAFYAEYICDATETSSTTPHTVTATSLSDTATSITTSGTSTTTPHTLTTVSVTTHTADLQLARDLTAYWDNGNCGPYGDDHNLDFCPSRRPGQHGCRPIISVDTATCADGVAYLQWMLGNGNWGSYTDEHGCGYTFWAQYGCSPSTTTTTTTTTSTTVNENHQLARDLTVYWDSGNCGPLGDDHNLHLCPGHMHQCPNVLATDACPSGAATIASRLGGGDWASYTDPNGCKYAFIVRYECSDSAIVAAGAAAAPEPEPENTVEGTMQMEVNDVAAFVTDPAVRVAIGNSIAAMAGVPPSYVLVNVQAATNANARRLATRNLATRMFGRRLQSGSVVIDYIIVIPASSALFTSVSNIGSALSNAEPQTVSQLMETEVSAQVGSATFSLSVTELAAPITKLAPTTTSTTGTGNFEEEWAHLWPVTPEPITDAEAAATAGPQLAVLLVVSLSGAFIACTIAHKRLKRGGKGGMFDCSPCKGWDDCVGCGGGGCGWDEPALEELEDRELPEDTCSEPDMEVDCYASPLGDAALKSPKCQRMEAGGDVEILDTIEESCETQSTSRRSSKDSVFTAEVDVAVPVEQDICKVTISEDEWAEDVSI